MDQNTVLIALTIDENLRTIAIPTNGVVFGVVGDVEVNRVQFILPRYFRGFDLTDFTARVNYANPNGDANYYEADDITDTDGNCTFTWLMGSDVTAYVGDVKFSITLYKKEGDIVAHRFGTRASVGRVLEGYSVEDSVTPAQQKTLVDKISEEVKNSLPDYSDLEESISQNATNLNDLSTRVRRNSSDINTLKDNAATNASRINNITSVLGLPELVKSTTSYPIKYNRTTIFATGVRPQFLYTDNLFNGLSKNIPPIAWFDKYDNPMNMSTDRYLAAQSDTNTEYNLHFCDGSDISDKIVTFPIKGFSHAQSQITQNILYLGDDLLADGRIMKVVDTWLKKYNVNPNYLGTLTTTDGILHECRKHFNSYYYTQPTGPNPSDTNIIDVLNPFFSSGRFDVDYYMNAHSYQSITDLIVVVSLCRNEYLDMSSGQISKNISDSMVLNSWMNVVNPFIFRNNNIKVLALTDISPCSYAPFGATHSHHVNNIRMTSLLTNQIYSASESRGQLYILPTHLLNDPIYNFNWVDTDANMYANSATEKLCSEPMKLSDGGCEQIGYAIADAINYLAQQD